MQTIRWSGIVLIITLALSLASCVQPASDETAPEQVGANATWTNTPPPTQTPQPTTLPTETSAVAELTDLPTNTDTPTPTPTDAESAFIAQNELTLVAQDDTNPLVTATEDPNFGNAQISGSQLTATAIIAEATSTQSFVLTSTANAMFGATEIPAITETPFGNGQGVITTATPDPIIAGQNCIHEVKAQDSSLYRLSLAYGVTVNQIAQASGIVNPNLIRVGQMLTIPGCGTTGARPPATSTPNPNTFGTGGATGNPDTGQPTSTECNTWGTSVICPGGTGANTGFNDGTTTGAQTGGPTAGSRVHVVEQGQTLYEISLLYGVTMDAIASINGIANYDNIDFNTELVIP
jgi:LysM repeat protein